MVISLYMNPPCLLLRYGELFLKGRNRGLFLRKLMANTKKIAGARYVKKTQGRLFIEHFAEHRKLRQVFGLNSYSPAWKTEKELEKIKEMALKLLEGKLEEEKKKKGTFKIEARRPDKSFPVKSPELKILVGKYIEEKNQNLKFSFENPQTVLEIEIAQDGAYLFMETIPCFGGLPTGVEGKVYLRLEGEASLLAGLLMMKRGSSIIPVGKGDLSRYISLLEKFSPEKLELRKEIEEPDMPVVVGQTFENYHKLDAENLVFRPLIGFSEGKVKEELERFRGV